MQPIRIKTRTWRHLDKFSRLLGLEQVKSLIKAGKIPVTWTKEARDWLACRLEVDRQRRR